MPPAMLARSSSLSQAAGKSTGGRRSMAKCEKARQWHRDYFDLEMPVSLLRCGGLRMQREAPARRNVGPQFAHVSRGFNSRDSRTRRSRRSGRIALRPETQGIRQLRPLRHEIDKGRETGTEAIAAGVGTTLDAEDPIGGRPSGGIEVIKLAFGWVYKDRSRAPSRGESEVKALFVPVALRSLVAGPALPAGKCATTPKAQWVRL